MQPMRTPPSVLADLVRSDSSRPRLTFYDDAPGPTQGERIELSGRVFANWVAKAANALQEEYDAGPGSIVRIDLPVHWRALYWAFAAWSVGATVDLRDRPDQAGAADVVVTTDPAVPPGGPIVQVTLPALARAAPGMLPAGVMDEARELATYADAFDSWADPEPADSALVTDAGATSYAEVVDGAQARAQERGGTVPRGVRLGVSGAPVDVLLDVLAVWAQDGSVVVVREPDPAKQARRSVEEGVARWTGSERAGE